MAGVRINILAIEPGVEGAFATCRMRVAREPEQYPVDVADYFTSYGKRVKAWTAHQRNSSTHRKFGVSGGLQGRLQKEVIANKINVVVVPNGPLPPWLEEFLDWYAKWTLNSKFHEWLSSAYRTRLVLRESMDLREFYIMRVALPKMDDPLLPYYNGVLCRKAYRRIYMALKKMRLQRNGHLVEHWESENKHYYHDYRRWAQHWIPGYDPAVHKMTRKIKQAIEMGGGLVIGMGKLTEVKQNALARQVWELMCEDADDRAIGNGRNRTHTHYKSRKATQ